MISKKTINNSYGTFVPKMIITLFLIIIYAISLDCYADDLHDIEKALGIKIKSDCTNPPCEVDVNTLLNNLTSEEKEAERHNKLIDTPEAIKNSKNTPLVKMDQAELIILNKITAKSIKNLFNIGEIRYFGNLSIEVHKCIKSTDPFNANNLILLTIFDNKIEDDNLSVFHGWIVSSNPSISTLEHPVYEVIAVDCKTNDK